MYKRVIQMYITIDTSALIAVIGNEKTKPRIIEATKGCSLYSPSSVHWEIVNAFSAMFKRKSVTLEAAKQALAIYRGIPIKYIDVSLENTLGIAYTQGMYAYDAYLIQCALETSTPLLTLDKGLKAVAQKIGISIQEI